MQIPTSVPEKGFYYHYKHDPNGPVTNYAYELLGVGVHTEDNCRSEDANMAVYRPLYDTSIIYDTVKCGELVWLRPIHMWTGTVEREGKTIPRFTKIDDPKLIAKLTAIRDAMYP